MWNSCYLSIQSLSAGWSAITIRSGGPNVIRNVYKCTVSVIYQGNDILITAPVNKAKQTRLRAFTLNRLPDAKRGERSPCSSVRFQFSCPFRNVTVILQSEEEVLLDADEEVVLFVKPTLLIGSRWIDWLIYKYLSAYGLNETRQNWERPFFHRLMGRLICYCVSLLRLSDSEDFL